MSLIQIIEFQTHSDGRGDLVAIESGQSIPFEYKRIYYLTNLSAHPRGFHCHKHLQQVAICLNGSCTFVLDDGKQRQSVTLNRANQGLLIGHKIWREMHDFSEGCVVLVLASEHFDEDDYIRDYDTFKSWVQQS